MSRNTCSRFIFALALLTVAISTSPPRVYAADHCGTEYYDCADRVQMEQYDCEARGSSYCDTRYRIGLAACFEAHCNEQETTCCGGYYPCMQPGMFCCRQYCS